MSIELRADELAVVAAAQDRAGGLATVLDAAPMFRRALLGYDRFQVESYARWAEDELAAADREREHLLARHVEVVTALDEARERLSHSAEGGEFLRVSTQIGALLAAAADEAEGVRAGAEEDRRAAVAEGHRIVADARRRAAATARAADRSLAAARTEAADMVEQARATMAAAEQAAARLRSEAAERLARVRELERRAAADAQRVRERATDEAAIARLQARDEIVRMLAAAREERRRAEAAAVRLSPAAG